MTLLATRRQADDLQTLLDGGRPRSPHAVDDLAALVALASSLRPAPHAPRTEFRAQLRERLLAEAVRPIAPLPQQRPAPARRSVSWRLRQVAATVAVASLVAGAGAAVASTRALPGDTLYGLKRQIENVQLNLARGDVDRGRELLDQADARLSEAEVLAASERGPETDALVGKALADLDVAFTAAADDLTQAYRDSGDDEPLLVLNDFVTGHRERLADLMQLLDPSLRDRARLLANRFEVVGARLSALLGGSDFGRPAAAAQPSSGEEWPVNREVGVARRAAGTMAAGLGAAAGTTGSGGAVGGVLDSLGGAAGAATGDSPSGDSGSGTSGSGGTSGGLIDDLTGSAGTASGPGLPAGPAPLPGATLVPSPIPTLLPSDPVSAVTSAVPLPVTTCVLLPPLTSCP